MEKQELVNWNAQNTGNMVGHLGIEFLEIGNGRVVGSMPVDSRTIQPFGIMHGGASAVLAETLGSVGSAFLIDNDTKIPVGIDVHVHHLKSVSQGKVIGTAEILHQGGKLHLWDIHIKNEQDQLIASSTLKVMIIEKAKKGIIPRVNIENT